MPVCWVARVGRIIEHNNGNVFVLNSSIQFAPFAACSPDIITFFSFAAPVMPADTFIIHLCNRRSLATCISKYFRFGGWMLEFAGNSHPDDSFFIVFKRYRLRQSSERGYALNG